MANNWLSITPVSGGKTGQTTDTTVTATAAKHTGRVERSATIEATSKGGGADTTIATQVAAAVYITVSSGDLSKTVPAYDSNTRSVISTVGGVSNASTIKLTSTATVISGVRAKLTVNGVEDTTWDGITNITVAGDPGATAEYSFTITFTVPENMSLSERKHILSLTTTGASSSTITITQQAGTQTWGAITVNILEYNEPAINGEGTTTIQDPVLPYCDIEQVWGYNGRTSGGGSETVEGETWSDVFTDTSFSCSDTAWGGTTLKKNGVYPIYFASTTTGQIEALGMKNVVAPAHDFTITASGKRHGVSATATTIVQFTGNFVDYMEIETEASYAGGPQMPASALTKTAENVVNVGLHDAIYRFTSGFVGTVAWFDDVSHGRFKMTLDDVSENSDAPLYAIQLSGNSFYPIDPTLGTNIVREVIHEFVIDTSCSFSFDTGWGTTQTASYTFRYEIPRQANFVTKINLTGGSFSYSKSVPAKGGQIYPMSSDPTVQTTFTSGSVMNGLPDSAYGTYSATLAIHSEGTAQDGFSTANPATGEMGVANRGTTEGAARKSSTITKTWTPGSWVPASGYGSEIVGTGTIALSDYAQQEANTVSYGAITISGSYIEPSGSSLGEDIPASGGTRASLANVYGSQTGTYTSGSSIVWATNSTSYPLTYSWGTAVTAASRGTTIGDRRSAGTLTFIVTGKDGTTAEKGFTVYQQANNITNIGEITLPDFDTTPKCILYFTYEQGNKKTIADNLRQTLTYTSGSDQTLTSGGTRTLSIDNQAFTNAIVVDNTYMTIATGSKYTGVKPRQLGEVVYHVENYGKVADVTLTCWQNGAESAITITPESITFVAAGESKGVTVSANDTWTASIV